MIILHPSRIFKKTFPSGQLRGSYKLADKLLRVGMQWKIISIFCYNLSQNSNFFISLYQNNVTLVFQNNHITLYTDFRMQEKQNTSIIIGRITPQYFYNNSLFYHLKYNVIFLWM